MTTPIRTAALAAASSLALTGCLLSPGTFSSELQLMEDGSFSFSYDGEIQMLALSQLAQMGAAGEEEFEAECIDEETFETRECTLAEVNEQRAEWQARAGERRAEAERNAEQARQILGGLDPSDPEAAEKLAGQLERQRGWEKVDYVGDGIFDVDFRVSGRMTHDFAFPMIEKIPLANTFVTVMLRDGDQVRVDAPGFALESGGNPMQGMMAGMLGLASLGAEKEAGDGKALPRVLTPNGKFTIVTDGRILANNTDEGPVENAHGKALVWDIDQRTQQAPTALIAFD